MWFSRTRHLTQRQIVLSQCDASSIISRQLAHGQFDRLISQNLITLAYMLVKFV